MQIIEKFKKGNFTKATSDENLRDKLASLNKILNVDEGTESSVRNISLHLERIINLLSRDESLENSANSVVSPFMTFLNEMVVV